MIGPRIETWLLAQVTQADPEGIDECLEAGMLVKQAEELAFRHELARQALLETIPPYKQQILHRLTLAGLKDAGGARQNLARLALHAEAAGEPQSVLEYAPAAAREASAASAHREAASLYHLALKHAELLPPAEHAILLEAYAEETNAFDQRLDSIAAYQQALEIWRSLGDASRQGSLLASLTSMMTARGQDAAAESYARQAIAILEGIPPGLALADAYRKKAFIELGNRNFDQALGWIEKSAALVESQGSKKDAFRAQLLSGLVYCDIGAYEYNSTTTPTPSFTPYPSNTPHPATATPTHTAIPTVTASPSPSLTATSGPSPTASATSSPGPSPTATATIPLGDQPSPTPTNDGPPGGTSLYLPLIRK